MEVSQHILVPKHTKISAKEKEELFKEHAIVFLHLPKIKKSDPALIELDCKEGDVIKIERTSSTAGTTVFYRGILNE
ncbi:MAG: DNA-directed RNA polymerase subunit H (RpoH/RPB5) [Candidatus Woesearchaeota archaeon]|jgi:DNA-directed RNA polymerase subunit H (RpoH/RPB5)